MAHPLLPPISTFDDPDVAHELYNKVVAAGHLSSHRATLEFIDLAADRELDIPNELAMYRVVTQQVENIFDTVKEFKRNPACAAGMRYQAAKLIHSPEGEHLPRPVAALVGYCLAFFEDRCGLPTDAYLMLEWSYGELEEEEESELVTEIRMFLFGEIAKLDASLWGGLAQHPMLSALLPFASYTQDDHAKNTASTSLSAASKESMRGEKAVDEICDGGGDIIMTDDSSSTFTSKQPERAATPPPAAHHALVQRAPAAPRTLRVRHLSTLALNTPTFPAFSTMTPSFPFSSMRLPPAERAEGGLRRRASDVTSVSWELGLLKASKRKRIYDGIDVGDGDPGSAGLLVEVVYVELGARSAFGLLETRPIQSLVAEESGSLVGFLPIHTSSEDFPVSLYLKFIPSIGVGPSFNVTLYSPTIAHLQFDTALRVIASSGASIEDMLPSKDFEGGKEAFNPLSTDPLLVYNYAVFSGFSGVAAVLFWFTFRGLDKEERTLNEIGMEADTVDEDDTPRTSTANKKA
ncbi:POT family protein [Pseudohyphozyma bogoriensis]|nr:POT family protein [Pseudohyphozyma bogoriensis]